jgi:hypothetical protein
MRSTRLFLLCLTISLITSCATADECSWSKRIVVTDADQLSRPTKEQIVAHNRKVAAFCRTR